MAHFEFILPDLGEGVHEAEILQWFVAVGEPIEEDAPLVEVETDKAAVIIPSPRGGTVVTLGGEVGAVIHVGEIVAVIDQTGAAIATPLEQPTRKTEAGAPVQPVEGLPPSPEPPASQAPASTSRAPGPVPAAPATRRLARELGVDIGRVAGSGPAGRITAKDVRAAGTSPAGDRVGTAEVVQLTQAAAALQAPAEASGNEVGVPLLDLAPLPDFAQWGPVEVEPLRSIRRKTARRMVTSKVLIPHVAHMDDADVTDLEALRHRVRERTSAGDPRVTLLAFVVKAVAAGLHEWPQFNASVDAVRETIAYKKYYNIGIAVDTERGLMVPVIREADRKSILDIARDITDLALRGRQGTLDAADFQGGTFTVTNVGPLGGTNVIPAINYPEAGILGMGRVQERPAVHAGEVLVRQILGLTLSFDHRVADGANAARFVTQLKQRLEDPERFFLET